MRIKTLEEEVEMMRRALHRAVSGEPNRLSSASLLPLSRRLDTLLNQYYIEKLKEKRFG